MGTGNSIARFSRSGTRLLCSRLDPELVVYDLPTLQYPTNDGTGKVVLSAPGFDDGDIGVTACCLFMGIDDEMVISGSKDDNLYIRSLLEAKKHQY